MGELQLSQADARRIAVRAQLLDEPRPSDLLDLVRHLGSVQVDLTAAVAPAPTWSAGAGWVVTTGSVTSTTCSRSASSWS